MLVEYGELLGKESFQRGAAGVCVFKLSRTSRTLDAEAYVSSSKYLRQSARVSCGSCFFDESMSPTSLRLLPSGRCSMLHCVKTPYPLVQDDPAVLVLAVGGAQSIGRGVHQCRQRRTLRRRAACTDPVALPCARQILLLPWECTTLLSTKA
jgi:hypothetical protein